MTTIACKDGVLAADRQSVGGWTKIATDKLYVLPDGRAAAIGGGIAHAAAMLTWLVAGGDTAAFPAPLGSEADSRGVLVVVDSSGLVLTYEHGPHPIRHSGLYAWGSGRDAAMAGMLCGLSSVEAVRLASRIDAGTGPDVDGARGGGEHPQLYGGAVPARSEVIG